MSVTFRDPNKWVLNKFGDYWHLAPPIGSFWGVHSVHPEFEQARASFVEQTSHIRGAA